ncbi:DEAD/DEAH box helicase [Alcaligenes sp. SDU_A2]|uniref:DEAD/DEAH box helicase n=1 Tax=Alcaligenes sp. SDU_A2 TaxID=3136634 RepID=UPI00311E503B
MAATLEELRANIDEATTADFRDQLLVKGQARGMIWREGVLPEDCPKFSVGLSDQLLSFGYSLLLHGLRYLDLGGDESVARRAFEVAAEAIEAVVARGEMTVERDFHRLVAAASYHLGRYSARAYSLLHSGLEDSNFSTIERCLAKLMLRDLDGVLYEVVEWHGTGVGTDEALFELLSHPNSDAEEDANDDSVVEVMALALDGSFMAAMSQILLALERGDDALVQRSKVRLRKGLGVAGELNLVNQWWVYRLAVHIIDGLWKTSFHVLLPTVGPPDAEIGNWNELRKFFIASLVRRRRAEVELWPSQLDAARRVLNFDMSFVVSLPTSAGKTRIAELCILACLARGKRVIFVTPLRALSAQTEVTLRRTFAPLGKTVSSLYGSIGASGADVDVLRTQHIVVSTPEKLDFALRSDPDLLDDIGLVVLDEGHMIGLGEREVRYEAQIQRLLRRTDAASRRIVCLSAILPDGSQLEDFTAWLTSDAAEGLIKNDWRPTRLRYGEVNWSKEAKAARLDIIVGDERPFVQKFVVGKTLTERKNAKVYPSTQTELCIFTAWRLMDEGQSVLVFCPLRASVIPFARRIVELNKDGLIGAVLEQPLSAISTALSVGAEWFGPDHVILKCLRLGVAVHHGELPTPFRKEIEKLLRDGVLRLTISSPTLAQGLNLSATSLVFHGHFRSGKTIDVSEFRNVVGRAGRAFVDIEGLVLYPMFDEHQIRRKAWSGLITNAAGREMESGLLRLMLALMQRIAKKLQTESVAEILEYVAGQGAWDFPVIEGEKASLAEAAINDWANHLVYLDTAIFSLLSDTAVADNDVESKLDEVLASSLFLRRLMHRQDGVRKVLVGGLKARANFIWSNSSPAQRRGYFLAGVGLTAGRELDEKAELLEELLLRADVAIDCNEPSEAIIAIVGFAEIVFKISPFIPRSLPNNWRVILQQWLLGDPVPNIEADDPNEVLSVIEHAFVYNLPWAMEAVRVRAEAHQDILSTDITLASYEGGRAVGAVETGTMSVAAATLIKAGFSSRLGAIKAVNDTNASFGSLRGMMSWLSLDAVQVLQRNPNWPTSESHELWLEFIQPHIDDNQVQTWSHKTYSAPVKWDAEPVPPGLPLLIGGGPGKESLLYTEDYEKVGEATYSFNKNAVGLTIAVSTAEPGSIHLEYIGPDDLIDI